MTDWAEVAVAPNETLAESWRDLLERAGVPARIESRAVASFMGLSSVPCRVLVPSDHLKQATEILAGVGEGPSDDADAQ